MKKNVYGILALLACAMFLASLSMKISENFSVELWLGSVITHLTSVQLPEVALAIIGLFCTFCLAFIFLVLFFNEMDKEKQVKMQTEMKNKAMNYSLNTWRVARAMLSLDEGDLYSIVLLKRRDGQCKILHVIEGHKYFNSFAFLEEGDEVLLNYSQDNQAEDWVTFPSNYLIPTVVGNDSSGK